MKVMNINEIDINNIVFNSTYYNHINEVKNNNDDIPEETKEIINENNDSESTDELTEISNVENTEVNENNDLKFEEVKLNFNTLDQFVMIDTDTTIVSISPLSLYCTGSKDKKGSYKYVLIFLAKTLSGKLFTLNTVYQVESENEYKFAKLNVPFFNERDNYNKEYSRQNIDAMLKNTIPAFISDLEATTDNVLNNSIKKFSINAVAYDEMPTTVQFVMDPAIFCCIKFTESYIRDCIVNNHDIIMSSAHGFSNTPMNLFVVDDVDSIISMAKVDRKSKDITVLVRTTYYIDKGVKEFLSLLFTTNPGTKFSRKKFNTTIEKINESYMEDADQYLAELMFDTRINDKAYTCYLAQNKNKEYKLFIFDTKTQTDLTNMVLNFNN